MITENELLAALIAAIPTPYDPARDVTAQTLSKASKAAGKYISAKQAQRMLDEDPALVSHDVIMPGGHRVKAYYRK